MNKKRGKKRETKNSITTGSVLRSHALMTLSKQKRKERRSALPGLSTDPANRDCEREGEGERVEREREERECGENVERERGERVERERGCVCVCGERES